MIDTPHITQTAAQLTAIIRLTIPRSEIRKLMGPGISEVMAAVAAQGVGPAGRWLTHHLKMDLAHGAQLAADHVTRFALLHQPA